MELLSCNARLAVAKIRWASGFRHFARQRVEMTSEIRQRGVVEGLEQRQQGLANRATFGPHAAQQQHLAFLVGPPEFELEEDWNQDRDGKKTIFAESDDVQLLRGSVSVFRGPAVSETGVV